MIYFARAVGLDLVKIGHTAAADADARLATLQTGCPAALELVATMPGDPETERELHNYFAHLRVRGEWFREADGLQTLIAGLVARRGRLLSEDTGSPEGESNTRWFSPDRPPEWRIAGVAELAYRRGFQHGVVLFQNLLARCRVQGEVPALVAALRRVVRKMRFDGEPHPNYLHQAEYQLLREFPRLAKPGEVAPEEPRV